MLEACCRCRVRWGDRETLRRDAGVEREWEERKMLEACCRRRERWGTS